MSRTLLKKSLSILEDESQTQRHSNDTKKAKNLENKTSSDELNGNKRKQKRCAIGGDRNQPQVRTKYHKQLVANRVKYHLVKDAIDRKQTQDNKLQESNAGSVFTEKDFRDFVANYK